MLASCERELQTVLFYSREQAEAMRPAWGEVRSSRAARAPADTLLQPPLAACKVAARPSAACSTPALRALTAVALPALRCRAPWCCIL